jgi:hypothetical protein
MRPILLSFATEMLSAPAAWTPPYPLLAWWTELVLDVTLSE